MLGRKNALFCTVGGRGGAVRKSLIFLFLETRFALWKFD